MTDPTLELLAPSKEFTLKSQKVRLPTRINAGLLTGGITKDIRYKSDPAETIKEYYDESKLDELNHQKARLFSGLDRAKFNVARDTANPFSDIGNSISKRRTFVKLANIDAIFSITGYTYHPSGSNVDKDVHFADLAGAPGGFTQYIQYRLPLSKGDGISLSHSHDPSALLWDRDLFDKTRFTVGYGTSGNGDLYVDAPSFANALNLKGGVNFIVADGGIDVKGSETIQEQMNTRLQVAEVLVALTALRIEGNFVLKMYDLFTKPSMDILYILSHLFDAVYIFKPISSRPANSEKYIVCKGFEPNRPMRKILLSVIRTVNAKTRSGTTFIHSIIKWDDKPFVERVSKINSTLIDYQALYIKRTRDVMKGIPVDDLGYSVGDVYMYWDIPNSEDSYKLNKVAAYDRDVDEETFLVRSFKDEEYSEVIINAVKKLLSWISDDITRYIKRTVNASNQYNVLHSIYTTINDVISKGSVSLTKADVKLDRRVVKYINTNDELQNILFIDHYSSIAESAVNSLYSKGKPMSIYRLPLGNDRTSVESVKEISADLGLKPDVVVLHASVSIEGTELIGRANAFLDRDSVLVVSEYPGPFTGKRYVVSKVANEIRLIYGNDKIVTLKNVTQRSILTAAEEAGLALIRVIEPPETPESLYTLIFTGKSSKRFQKEITTPVITSNTRSVALPGVDPAKSNLFFGTTTKRPLRVSVKPFVPGTITAPAPTPQAPLPPKTTKIVVPLPVAGDLQPKPNVLMTSVTSGDKKIFVTILQEGEIPGGTLTRAAIDVMSRYPDATFYCSLFNDSPQFISLAYANKINGRPEGKTVVYTLHGTETAQMKTAKDMGITVITEPVVGSTTITIKSIKTASIFAKASTVHDNLIGTKEYTEEVERVLVEARTKPNKDVLSKLNALSKIRPTRVNAVNLEGYASLDIKIAWSKQFARAYGDVIEDKILFVPVRKSTRWMEKSMVKEIESKARKIIMATTAKNVDWAVTLTPGRVNVPYESDITGKRLWNYVYKNRLIPELKIMESGEEKTSNLVILNTNAYSGISDKTPLISIPQVNPMFIDATPGNYKQHPTISIPMPGLQGT